jgi:3-methyladenine DNA glycosylase AlkD
MPTLRSRLRALADPARIPILQSFFKTGQGEYAEGDRFIGIRVPQLRQLCRECRGAGIREAAPLLRSEIHEERLFALLLLVDAFRRADEAGRKEIYDFYLANTPFINNWDLVDASAEYIVGAWLQPRSRAPLTRLARSSSLWERRIAVVATLHLIRRGELNETFRMADILMDDPHDLIHKATGWMLREAGKRDGVALRRFLATRHHRMPRTMLRYAIERFPEAERRKYLGNRPGRLPYLDLPATGSKPASTRGRSSGRSTKSSPPRKSVSLKRKPNP